MNVSDFDFALPDELVAQRAAPRGESRLLILDRATGARRHASVADLPSSLRRGDLLVVNNTRVLAARLLGHRVPSGGAVQCLLLGPASVEQQHMPSQIRECLMHPGQKLKPGALVRFEGASGVLMAEVLARQFHGRRTIRLWAERGSDAGGNLLDVDSVIEAIGHMPLPPYIRRGDTPEDRDRYQTIFARVPGSIAAPTAGLHISRELLETFDRHGIERAELTLHVGYGTFKPVRTERVEDHVVDPEHYEISSETAARVARAKAEGRRVIAVGTTTTRALEDAALRGRGQVEAGPATALAFIHPGHQFQVIDGLVTNFHLPASSLLMLVAAFAGRERVLDAYREAVEQRYRFYSYGDAMLIV